MKKKYIGGYFWCKKCKRGRYHRMYKTRSGCTVCGARRYDYKWLGSPY